MNKYKRLKKIKEYIPKDARLLDIGTDHGILPEMCYCEKLCKKIVATDISEKSLEKLREKIEDNNMDIETHITDGLNNLNLEDIDTITISGMGGFLIIDILKDRIDELKNKRLILSPQSGIAEVRKFLIQMNFDILYEDMVFEDNKYYNIIVFEYGKNEEYTEIEYIFGKISKHQNKELLMENLKREKNIKENILNNIGYSNGAISRRNNLTKELEMISEVERCISMN